MPTVKLTIVSNTTYNIEVEVDGDNVHETKRLGLLWADLQGTHSNQQKGRLVRPFFFHYLRSTTSSSLPVISLIA